MRRAHGTSELPRALFAPRLSSRAWLALAAGLGCGVCAYAGLYPRFDQGSLRIIVALTCAPFGAAVVAAALSARTAGLAFGRAICLAALLGMAVTIVPAGILSYEHPNEFVPACIFGAVFGAFTGALYGIPLAVLTALGHRHLQADTHEATDRASRSAGAWLLVIALIALAGTRLLDGPTEDWQGNPIPGTALFPSFVAGLTCFGAVSMVASAIVRRRRRAAWLERVRSGLEPAFRVRVAEPRDETEKLPRLAEGTTVVEWCPDEVCETTAGNAYRMSATGRAVALVDDRVT